MRNRSRNSRGNEGKKTVGEMEGKNSGRNGGVIIT
jgi:hypothetical protein